MFKRQGTTPVHCAQWTLAQPSPAEPQNLVGGPRKGEDRTARNQIPKANHPAGGNLVLLLLS